MIVRLAALAFLCLVAGCAVRPTGDIATFAAASGANSFEVFDRRLQSPQALVLPVVHDAQKRGPACGAHALASVITYWNGAGAATGEAIFTATPPASKSGYSMAEIMALAQRAGLLASAVRLTAPLLVRELESGRPVLIPVRLPSIYVQQRALPGGELPVVGVARNALIWRAARVSEFSRLALVDHYLLVVGYEDETFVVVEPVMGYRTISFTKLARYRRAFDDAAIVFSAPRPARGAGS